MEESGTRDIGGTCPGHATRDIWDITGHPLKGVVSRMSHKDVPPGCRVVVIDHPNEPLALVVYPPDAAFPQVVTLTPGRALDLAAQLITAARRRMPEAK